MSSNLAASIHQRLLNHARSEGRRFNEVLQRYALERWLYRLSISSHADRFILKGGLLLSTWDLPVQRPTKDIDLLVGATNDLDGVCDMIRETGDGQGTRFNPRNIFCIFYHCHRGKGNFSRVWFFSGTYF